MNTLPVTNSAVSQAVSDAKPEMVKQQRETKSEAASVHADAASKVPQISLSGVDIVA
jgi:predicted transcriptional regulator